MFCAYLVNNTWFLLLISDAAGFLHDAIKFKNHMVPSSRFRLFGLFEVSTNISIFIISVSVLENSIDDNSQEAADDGFLFKK